MREHIVDVLALSGVIGIMLLILGAIVANWRQILSGFASIILTVWLVWSLFYVAQWV